MELERIRGEIAKILADETGLDYRDLDFLEQADQILSIKLGETTLRGLIELYDKGKLVKLADDQMLPRNPYYLDEDMGKSSPRFSSYEEGIGDMLKANFKKVKPL